MKYFGMPADFKKETIDAYDNLNKNYSNCKVGETYGQVTIGNQIESGRPLNLLPSNDFAQLKEYFDYSKSKNIEFNYTINAPHMNNKEFTKEGVSRIMDLLDAIYAIGIRWLTISMPSLMELVRSSKYDFKIKASTICQITSVNKALWLKELGADRIVVDESINRNFKLLEGIKKVFGEQVEVIINSICHKDCVNRMFHYNQIAGDSVDIASDASVNYYPHRCAVKRFEDLSNFMKLTWVRPEDLKYYSQVGINYFKLQGRHLVLNGNPQLTIESYFKEDFEGNLMDLLDMFSPTNSFKIYIDNKKLAGFVEKFYENSDFCKSNCQKCGYCNNYAKKSIDYEEAQEIAELAKMFYSQYDQFSQLTQSK
jgi:collagenase-like PrtC family protease